MPEKGGKGRQRRGRPGATDEPDARVRAALVEKVGEEVAPPGTYAVVVSPMTLDDGRLVFFQGLSAANAYLVEAKTLSDQAEQARRRAFGTLHPRPDGEGEEFGDQRAVIDAQARGASAVVLAVAAIEAFANDLIEHLPDKATVTIDGEERGAERLRWTRLDDKLHLVVPVITGRPSVKGQKVWQDYILLRRLRDSLTHVTKRGYSADAAVRSPYGRLLNGEAAFCAEVAGRLIAQLDPDHLTPGVVAQVLRASEPGRS